jgi:hypothetical protein
MIDDRQVSLLIQCGKCGDVWEEPLAMGAFEPLLVGCRVCPICQKETTIHHWYLKHRIYGVFEKVNLDYERRYGRDEWQRQRATNFTYPKVRIVSRETFDYLIACCENDDQRDEVIHSYEVAA